MRSDRGTGRLSRLLSAILCGQLICLAGASAKTGDEYYTDPQLYGSRPAINKEKYFGQVGVTGLDVRIYEGVAVTVEGTTPGTPAAGKFKKGDVIVGINGVALRGKNPYVTLGKALTKAEATDGRMVFEVRSGSGQAVKKIAVVIPVLGAYGETWPLSCGKSETIIRQAAEYYAGDEGAGRTHFKGHGMPGGLACLFLLSTGDDRYLPRVKAYFDGLGKNVKGIGDHTWNNGYNGIACAEYYLRTGDKSALPILQYYCDNAKERQYFGVGWTHWGRGISPGYVASGLMNPAGAQIVTTLLLAKECGVKVDEQTLLGALRQWYRFVGHGTVPYGDHRGEGGLGSNGKDGMAAAMMQIAACAGGDVAIYRQARDYLAMSTITSYPKLVQGHGDEGRGDGIWRGVASAYMLDIDPGDYHVAMDRLQWWYDLSRRPSGGLGMATCQRFDDLGSGAGVALAYTAPLKTLRITGAPRSKHAVDFTLPERLWGRETDLAFHSIEHGKPYYAYGGDEPVHVPYYKFGGAYRKAADGLDGVSREEMLKNVHHKRYMIRAQAAKALRRVGAFGELEKLLRDKDPRVRRAALDGLTDYRYWFAMGKDPIKTEDMSQGMIAALKTMIGDPDEALYVVDGALMAMSRAPVQAIADSLPQILPWTTHEDWWLRQSSFLALNGAAKDDALLPKVLPTMVGMLVNEYRTQAREGMQNHLTRLLRTHKPDSTIGREIVGALKRAAKEGEILSGLRAGEGAHNVARAVTACLSEAPGSAVDVAAIVKARFSELETRKLSPLVDAFLAALDKLPDTGRVTLTGTLYNDYRRELIRRMEAGEEGVPLDTILSLTKLKSPELGWQTLGRTKPADRTWRFTSFEPQSKDALHPREKKRFRNVTLPKGLEGWHDPEFDAGEWQSGKAPVGKGLFKRGRTSFANQSTWGDGEFLLMRTTFEVDSLDYDFYRISVLANQGFRIYLNGRGVHTYIWWKDDPHYRPIGLGPGEQKHLKKGVNVLAVYANAAYPKGEAVGQIDVRLEGLRKSDLLGAR
jgi:hypothetical protein